MFKKVLSKVLVTASMAVLSISFAASAKADIASLTTTAPMETASALTTSAPYGTNSPNASATPAVNQTITTPTTMNVTPITTYDELVAATNSVTSSSSKITVPAGSSYRGGYGLGQVSVNEPCTIRFVAGTSGTSSSLDIKFYSDSACTLQVGGAMYLSTSALTDSEDVAISTPGTYYIKASVTSYTASTTDIPISVSALQIKNEINGISATGTLFQGKGSTAACYHSFTVSQKSVVTIGGYTISGSTQYGLGIDICDANKVVLESDGYLSDTNSYTASYVLAPGNYYVSTTTNSLGVLAMNTQGCKTAATKNKKAKKLSKKKVSYGSFAMTDSTSKKQVFKIVLKKKAKLKFVLAGPVGNASYLRWKVTTKNGSRLISNSGVINANSGGGAKSSNALKKGTYYITITKYGDDDSCYFGIKQK